VEKKYTKGLEGMHELKYSEIEMENAITSNFHNYKKLEKLYINFRKVIELKYN